MCILRYTSIVRCSLRKLVQLRLGFSHLHKHRFQHNFQDTLNLLCSSSIEAKTMLHFFLQCQFSIIFKKSKILMNDLMNIDRSLPSLSQGKLISVLLHASDAFDNKTNCKIFVCTIQFIKDSHRFNNSLF